MTDIPTPPFGAPIPKRRLGVRVTNATIRTVRNLALAVAAGAEIVEAAAGVPTSVDTVAICLALAAHVVSASIDRYEEATSEPPV